MFKRLVSLVVVLSLLTGAALYAAGAPAMQWHKGHGTSFGNHVHEGMQTSDGGYIGIGQTWDSSDYPEMLVIKTYSNGNKEWQKVIGTSGQPDIGICIAEVSDGFICGGGLYDSGNMRRALVKLDFNGNIVSGWPKYYSGSQGCAIRGVDITGDGSIVATGYKNSTEGAGGYVFICDDGDGFIMKTDADGNVIWDKGLSVPQGTKVRQISGGFAVASCAWYFDGSDHLDAVLIKTDSSGNETNKYHYGGSGTNDFLYDFDLTSDGGYILGGHTTSYGSVNHDFYLAKVNSSFTEQWHKTFGQPRGYDPQYIHDEAYGVRQTPDGGYIIAGGSGDEYDSYTGTGHPAGNSNEWKAYLVKTDPDGNLLWEDVYPPTSVGNTAGEYLGLTTDGGYIVFTDTDAFWGTIHAEAMGFMKIAPDTPPPPTPPTPDMDGSGDVNFADYSLFAAQWMRTDCNDCNGADFTTEGNNVDYNDLDIFVDNWLRDYGLLGYWQLDGDANDSSGYSNDGMVHGGAVWVDDYNRGWCLSFDGDDDYVELGTISGTSELALAGSNFTICSWIKPNLTGDSYQRIVDKSNGIKGANGYSFWVHTDGKIAIHVASNGFRSDGSVITAGIWQHVVVTGDGSDYQFYVDGLPVAGSFVSGSYNSPPSVNTNMRIGTWNHSTGREFNGSIDDVRIYDKALNQQEIEALTGI